MADDDELSASDSDDEAKAAAELAEREKVEARMRAPPTHAHTHESTCVLPWHENKFYGAGARVAGGQKGSREKIPQSVQTRP